VLADQSSPTRLFATLSGALLVVGGTVGFFHTSTFGTPGEIEDALGFAVNGWINSLHIIVGILGLFAAGFAARAYSLGAAILFGALAIWGFATGSDDALLDRIPADEAENLVHALLAVLGLAAWLADRPKRERKSSAERPKRERKPKKERSPRDTKARREKREERDETKREEDRRKREEKRAKRAGAGRSPQSESADDSASRDDEPRTGRGRLSRRRRRPPRPPA
jgi:hypothetical protein